MLRRRGTTPPSGERALLRHARRGVGSPAASARACGSPTRPSCSSGTRRRAAPRRPRPPPGPRSGRPRAPPRRPGGRAAGTTRRRPEAARAPSRARRRTLRLLFLRAAPDDASRSGGAHRSRKSHLRRAASSSVTSRSGSATASGIPGEPPPEPTSTIGPSKPRTISTARERIVDQHRLGRLLVADRRQPRRRDDRREPVTAREDDDVAVRLRPLGAVSTPSRSFSSRWTTFRSTAVIGSSSTRSPAAHLLRRTLGERLERRAPALAVAGCVDDDFLALVAVRRCEIAFSRYCIASIVCPCRPMRSARRRRCSVTVTDSSSSTTSRRPSTPSAAVMRTMSIAHVRREIALVDRRRVERVRGTLATARAPARSRHRAARARPRRRPRTARPTCRSRDGAARARGVPPTSPRRPSRPLPRRVAFAHRRPPASSSGAPCAAAAVRGRLGLRRVRARRFAPLPTPSAVARRRRARAPLDEIGAAVFGIRRRVIRPWPTVHRFVVTQYRTRPAGNRAITNTKTSGMNMKRYALRLVRGRRHVQRRRHLAHDVDDEQDVAAPVGRRVRRDRRDEVQEREAARGRMLREVPQRVVERDENRQLDEHRQARSRRVDLVLPVELHQLFVLLLLVALVLLLDLLHLRRVALQVLHRVDLLHRQRHEQHPDDHGERDDRPRPREVERAVEPVENVARDVLERVAGSPRGREDASSGSPRRAGSKPPWLHGLQRRSRQPASALPRTRPFACTASIAYCEQDGWYLHVVGKSAPNVTR